MNTTNLQKVLDHISKPEIRVDMNEANHCIFGYTYSLVFDKVGPTPWWQIKEFVGNYLDLNEQQVVAVAYPWSIYGNSWWYVDGNKNGHYISNFSLSQQKEMAINMLKHLIATDEVVWSTPIEGNN